MNNIFKLNGKPSAENPYLFNGDFVDRGSWGLEVFITLLGWKLHDEKCMYLTRGNHETKSMNELYGFEGEVRHKGTCYSMLTILKDGFETVSKVINLYGSHGKQRLSWWKFF